ncbi:alpha/beta fold hydrolase [Chloroflexota bacterium]
MLRAADGVNLRFQTWCPAEDSKATLCLVHGHGDHSDRFADGVDELVRLGFSVCTFDLRGHGLSGGPRGDAPSYEVLLDDVGLLLDTARTHAPGLPRFLLGHSLGGNLVLNYALRRRPALAGLMAVNPWLDLAFRLPIWRTLAVRLVAAVRPDVPLSSRREPGVSSQGNGDSDPLVHHVITPRVFLGARDAARGALTNAANLNTPLLVIHGSEDHSTSAEASELFVERAQGDATFTRWDGLGHSFHGEDVERLLFGYVASWMASRVG